MFVWTPQATEKLKALWADGHPAQSVARQLVAEFGEYLTRSAVIGKAHRLKLELRSTTQRDYRQYKRATKPKASTAFNPPPPAPKAKKALVLPPDNRAPRPVEVIPEALRVALQDLKDHHCRYPFGEDNFTFCGRRRVPGISYCESHATTCFTGSLQVFADTSKNPQPENMGKSHVLEGVP